MVLVLIHPGSAVLARLNDRKQDVPWRDLEERDGGGR